MIIRTLLIFILSIYSQLFFANSQENSPGEYDVTSTSRQILGDEMAEQFKNYIDPDDEITWNVYIPKGFDPGQASGIMVYYTDKYPNQIQSGWKTATSEKNLIWISVKAARKFTNRKKMFVGVLATPLLQSKYLIQNDRIYISGDQTGCIMASNIAMFYPNIFSGAIYIGCRAQVWGKEEPPQIELMKKNRYAFVFSGRGERNKEMRRSLIKYNKSGIDNTLLKNLTERGGGGDMKLNSNHLKGIIDFLDGNAEE